jgi:hypothetical protein
VPNGTHTEAEAVARECGLRLLELSTIYERGVVRHEAGPATLAIVGLVARQRRLLRGGYLLADSGQRLEASILLRTMLEFLIRQLWLQSDPPLNYVLWALDDLRARLRIDREVRGQAPEAHGEALAVLEPEMREEYERSLEEMHSELDRLRERLGLERVPAYPNLREQAEAVGLGFSYSLAYRFDSLGAAHPSAMAVEQLFEPHPEGVRVLPEPPPERGYADPYGVGAFILRDALAHAAEQVPELRLAGEQRSAMREFPDATARPCGLAVVPSSGACFTRRSGSSSAPSPPPPWACGSRARPS